MNKIFLILATVLFVACSETTLSVKDDIVTFPVKVESSKTFANPFLIEGSDFGHFFQALYKLGKFDDMVKFTSSGTLAQFGSTKVFEFYKTMDFAYDVKLKSHNNINDTIVLNYKPEIMASRHMIRMKVVIENDSTKVVLENLNQPFK